jgi:hypothetical protein
MTINENALAKEICKREMGAVEIPIGQVKEQLKVTLEILGTFKMSDIIALIEKHQ